MKRKKIQRMAGLMGEKSKFGVDIIPGYYLFDKSVRSRDG